MSYIPSIKQMISNVTGATSIVVPANMYILGIVIDSTNANSITGGIKIGTSLGATDVVSVFAVTGNSLSHIPSSLILKRIFSKTASTTLYIDAVTLFNSANISVSFMLREVF